MEVEEQSKWRSITYTRKYTGFDVKTSSCFFIGKKSYPKKVFRDDNVDDTDEQF